MIKESQHQYHNLIEAARFSELAIIDDGEKAWKHVVEKLLATTDMIIAVRGPGTVNGIDKETADKVLNDYLIPKLQKLNEGGKKFAILYDGDVDNHKRSDIGYVVGRLLETFGAKNPNAFFVTAQLRSWYQPSTSKDSIRNAQGLPFITYIFDNTYIDGEGNYHRHDHKDFAQGQMLVDSPKFEQWFVGASGPIANDQLKDFNDKVPEGQKRRVTLVRARNRADENLDLHLRLDAGARDEGTQESYNRIASAKAKLEQRSNIYGAHWTKEGQPALNPADYPNLELVFLDEEGKEIEV